MGGWGWGCGVGGGPHRGLPPRWPGVGEIEGASPEDFRGGSRGYEGERVAGERLN